MMNGFIVTNCDKTDMSPMMMTTTMLIACKYINPSQSSVWPSWATYLFVNDYGHVVMIRLIMEYFMELK